MDVNLTKKVIETSYLTAEKVAHYRFILHLFYEEHKKVHYLLAPEEIFMVMQSETYFADYTMEELQRDLKTLVDWNNLIARQDVRRANSIEEFKQKRFIYQCTPYTIEIERMLERLAGITGYGGSLEPKFFDKLIQILTQVKKDWSMATDSEVALWWHDLMEAFRQLSQNATDYLAHLQSAKVESLMMTESFLAFKDLVTDHLRQFMQALQRSVYQIDWILRNTSDDTINAILQRVCDYELSIPRIDEERSRESIWQEGYGQWLNLKVWFLGSDGRKSDLELVQFTTNETIRKITRYAIRLGENLGGVKSRKQEYLTLARMFANLPNLEEAHMLSACTFGIFHTRHLYGEEVKSTERIDLSVWTEEPALVLINPRIRQYRGRTRPTAMLDNQAQKETLMNQLLEEKQLEEKLIAQYIKNGELAIAELPEVEPVVRKTILRWLDRAGHSRGLRGKTEDGRKFRVMVDLEDWVILRCTDGALRMPNYRFIFDEAEVS